MFIADEIEVLRPGLPRGRFRSALFDFDGTLSLIREGWPQVMIPMMVGALRETGTRETDAELHAAVEDFVMRLNGRQTLAENIADVAGLAAAYDAYRASLGGKEAPVIDGFTGDQRFFIAYAQAWASKMREAALRGRIATDGHAPGQYRALTVRNLDPWYAAFDIKPGDKLYLAPEKRVKVW